LKLIECEDEKDLLEKFIKDFQRDDPDIITAHNLDRYDYPKLRERMKHYKIKRGVLSPFNMAYKAGKRYRIKGRILFDLMRGYMELTGRELPSYSLEYICNNKEYGEGLNIPFVRINKSYKEDWESDPSRVIELNYWHVYGIRAYDESAEVVNFFDEVRREAGCLLNDSLSRKQILDTALLRLSHKRFALPTEKRFPKAKFPGAIVLSPVPGLHKNVISVDLSRAYPNIIIAFNISGDTVTTGSTDVNIDGIYKFVSSHKGIIPELLEEWIWKREAKKKLRLQAEKDGNKELEKKYKRQENCVKYTCNAAYGVMGHKSFRGFNLAAASAVTYLCRKGMEFAVIQLRKLGYQVIYGDTDSLFFVAKSKKPVDEAKEVLDILNEKFKIFAGKYKITQQPFELDLQKVYSEYWLVEVKKKYIGRIIFENGIFRTRIEIKGWDTVRSDASRLERRVIEDYLIMQLDEIPREEKWEYWLDLKERLDNREFPLTELGYAGRITKKIDEYGKFPKNEFDLRIVGLPAHVKAVIYSNKVLGTSFRVGAKPLRIPIDFKRFEGQETYPLKFEKVVTTLEKVKGKRGLQKVERTIEFKVTDIAIDNDTRIPKEFLDCIDWKRINKRLNKKINRVFKEKVKIEDEIKEKIRLRNSLNGYMEAKK